MIGHRDQLADALRALTVTPPDAYAWYGVGPRPHRRWSRHRHRTRSAISSSQAWRTSSTGRSTRGVDRSRAILRGLARLAPIPRS